MSDLITCSGSSRPQGAIMTETGGLACAGRRDMTRPPRLCPCPLLRPGFLRGTACMSGCRRLRRPPCLIATPLAFSAPTLDYYYPLCDFFLVYNTLYV
jgi:hypothetical protein